MLATQPCLAGRTSVLPLDAGEHEDPRMDRPAGEFWFAVTGGSVIVLAIAAVIASGHRVELLQKLRVPTLVLHGEDDPLLPVECGRDVARLVPAAEIQTYPGWGHDFPKGMIPTVIDRIVKFCGGK